MESVLYRRIFEKGEARGRAEGEVRAEVRSKRETILRLLGHRLGTLSPAVRERVETTIDLATLTTWYDQALLITDTPEARRLADQIVQ